MLYYMNFIYYCLIMNKKLIRRRYLYLFEILININKFQYSLLLILLQVSESIYIYTHKIYSTIDSYIIQDYNYNLKF